jgi:hypothetical protein
MEGESTGLKNEAGGSPEIGGRASLRMPGFETMLGSDRGRKAMAPVGAPLVHDG